MDTALDQRIVDFAEALVAGDLAAIRAFLADDYFGHARMPGEPSQADRWTTLLPAVREAVPDLRIELEPAPPDVAGPDVAGPDDVLVHAVVSGTHTGDLWGSPPTDRPFMLRLALRFRPAADGWLVQGEDPPSIAIATMRLLGVVPPADEMHLLPRNPIAPPEFLLKLGFTGRAADKPCTHLADARVFEPSTDVCGECLASGGFWPALRMCLVCGHVGCCDTSISKHAPAHYQATGHAIVRSIRLRERWMWCYADDAFFEAATLDRMAQAAAATAED